MSHQGLSIPPGWGETLTDGPAAAAAAAATAAAGRKRKNVLNHFDWRQAKHFFSPSLPSISLPLSLPFPSLSLSLHRLYIQRKWMALPSGVRQPLFCLFKYLICKQS